MKYIRRIIDDKIDRRAKAFDAICIVGPKGCGKTRTAAERAATVIAFQDEEKRAGYLQTVATAPSLMLSFPKPILYDEWQDAPKIWGTIRKACDETDNTGEFYLTGSTSTDVDVPHTGTGRISTIHMLPMSLYESGESNGSISLHDLIVDSSYSIEGKISSLKIQNLIYAACRGGWPRSLSFSDKETALELARDYYEQIATRDISSIDGIKRNATWTRAILKSYARNIATTVKGTVIHSDVIANYPISDTTFLDYLSALEKLYVIKDIDAWCPQIRSKTAIRGAKKRIFIDPSIAIAALGLTPEYFYQDMDLFGHVFENVVFRDLLAFAEMHDAQVLHYRDDYGLEIDAVYQMPNGEYALIEVKTGTSKIPEAEKNLLKFKRLIADYNAAHPEVPYREPSALIVICGTADMAFTTSNGVKVVPIGCLKD